MFLPFFLPKRKFRIFLFGKSATHDVFSSLCCKIFQEQRHMRCLEHHHRQFEAAQDRVVFCVVEVNGERNGNIMEQDSNDICDVSLRPWVVPFFPLIVDSEQVGNAATTRTDEAKDGDEDESKSETVIR
jgi:hypothetical protein